MGQREFGLRLKIDGDISDVLGSLKRLQNAFDTVEMPDSLTKSLSKDIANAIQKVGEFGKKGEAAINSLSDSKEVASAWKSVTKILTSLQTKLDDIDPSNIFPKEVTANLEKAEAAAKRYNKALVDAKGTDTYKAKLEQLNQIAERQKIIESSEKKAKAAQLQAEEALKLKQEKWTEEVNQKYEAQQKAIQDANTALDEQTKKVAKLVEQQKKLQEEGYLNADKSVSSKRKSQVEAAKQALPEAETEEAKKKTAVSTAKAKKTRYENKNKGADLSKDKAYLELKEALTKAEKEHGEAIERTKKLREEAGKLDKVEQASNIGAEITAAKELEKSLRGEAAAAKDAASELTAQKRAIDNAKTAVADATAKHEGYAKRLEEVEQETKDINNELKNIQTDTATKEWEELVAIIKEFTGVDLTQSAHDMQAVTTALDQYKEGKVKELPKILAEIVKNAKDAAPAVDRVGKEVKGVGDDAAGLAKAVQEMENLKNQVLQFFSITNAIQLFKRAITSALNTVKELDATMTEAAVVTEFDVGDMWEKLPQYSTEAQKLGVSINGMYQATTLYYQQGLKSNEAMELGIETMKMGKIAAMDSTDATKAMTAALRGFNMELNEMSATKVNDVYSQLAAVTAADTNQIATAMEKTASIAASANMEFETTAALLAQIIETTQEAPETAGTALKTIIARFAEVKSLREQGLSTGQDEEGEAIDVNKIQTALRTVGISMEGFFAGTEGLDSVLLKLSEKWGDLDFETQRYIATMAAGSRQQSRFIAMMSDYGRTTELVNEAQNSTGASQRQFEKTQESLATSLQKLKNAWDQFLMGLANNEVLKTGVDALTSIVETLNKATEILSGGNGLVKAVVSLGAALSALKIGNGILGETGSTGMFARIGGLITGKQPGGEGVPKKSLEEKLQGTRFGVPEDVDSNASYKWTKAQLKVKKRQKREEKQMAPDLSLEEKFNNKYKTKTKTTIDIDKDKLTEKMSSHVTFGGDNAGAIAELNQQLKEGKISAQDAAASFQSLGGDMDGIIVTSEKAATDFDALSSTLGNAGAAMMGVGTALGLLSGLFEALGLEEAAEATQIVAGVFMGLGTVLSVVSSILPIVTAMTAAQAAATWAALWPILLIVAALAAVVAIVAAVAIALQKASLEGRMKAAAEATEDAKQAAEGAKEAYDNLLSAKDEYKELQSTLENLTKGTDEWKQALIEANSQVLELLTTYPELAKYISRGEDGQLVISGEGWDKIISDQEKGLRNAQRNVSVSQIAETKLKIESAEDDFLEAAKKAIADTDSSAENQNADNYFTKSQADMVYDAYKKNGAELFKLGEDGSYSQALLDLAESVRQGPEEIYAMIDALADYDAALSSNEALLKSQAETALNVGASQEIAEYKYGDQVVQGFANSMVSGGYQAQVDKLESEMAHNKNGAVDADSGELAAIVQEYGLKNRMTDNDEENLKTIYAAMAGIDKSKIPEGMDKARLAEEIAKMRAAEKHSGKMEEFNKRIGSLKNADSERQIAALMSGDASTLTMGQLKAVQGKKITDFASEMGYGSAADMADALGYGEATLNTLSAEDQKAAIDRMLASGEITESTAQSYRNNDGSFNYASYLTNYGASTKVSAQAQLEIDSEQATQQMEQAYKDATEGIAKKTGMSNNQVASVLSDASIGAVEGISKQIAGMSREAATDYVQGWSNVVKESGLGEAQKDQLENYLANVDWSNMSQAIDAMDYMQELGMDTSVIENFWNTATNAAGTYVSTLSEALQLTERIQGKIGSVDEMAKRLAEGKATYNEVTEMVKAGVDISKFKLTSEGWQADASDTKVATDAMKVYYAKQARATADQHNERYNNAVNNNKDRLYLINGKATVSKDGQGLSGITTVDEATNKFVAGTVTNENVGMVSNILGLTQGPEETAEEYLIRVQKEYENYIALLNNGKDIALINEKTAAMAEAARYTADENAARGGSDESVRYSMQNEASELGLDVSAVTEYADTLGKIPGLSQQMADRIAIDHAKMNQGAKEINDNWDEWNKSLKSKNTLEYTTALTALRKSANKLLGTNTDLSDSFYENAKNQELMKKAANGNAKAMNELQKIAAKDRLKKLFEVYEDGTDRVNKLEGALDRIANADIKVGENVDVKSSLGQDIMSVYKQAYDAAIAGGADVQEALDAANSAISDTGFEVELTETTVTGTTPTGWRKLYFNDGEGFRTEPVEGKPYSYKTVDFGKAKITKKDERVTDGNKNSPSGGGGGKYENGYDKLHNTLEEINDLLRQRERLERQYQRLLDRNLATAEELAKISRQNIKNHEEEIARQEAVIAGRQAQIEERIAKNPELKKFVQVVEGLDGNKSIRIDWAAFEAIKSQKTGDKADAYYDDIKTWLESIYEAQTAIEDEIDAIYEEMLQGKDEYLNLEDQVKEAIINERQEQIDKLGEINDSINDTNGRLLESMQEQIDEYRQNRDNQKTEDEIADKQRKLAYLQMDTSGANATEILKLQKEIDEAQEDYTDTLIDQKISELQKQNDQAAEQRQRQIDIMQAQLDQYATSEAIWEYVSQLIEEGTTETGGLIIGSDLDRILKNSANYEELSEIQKMDWLNETNKMIAQGLAWLSEGAVGAFNAGKTISFTNADGQTVSGKVSANGDVVTEDGSVYTDVEMDTSGNYSTNETAEEALAEKARREADEREKERQKLVAEYGAVSDVKSKIKPGHTKSKDVKALQAALKWLGYYDGEIDGKYPEGQSPLRTAVDDFKANDPQAKAKGADPSNSTVGPGTKAAFEMYKFKTGGLADFTGPAWLDGTKSKPEYILNADQTKAFFTLVDVLSGLDTKTPQTTQNNGDSNYDIDINVETIGSDYDVEQLADKVKSLISEDARYRNNNTINLMR